LNIEQVTPLILTWNEEANLERTLSALRWAREILIVDSFSTDRTLEIAASFSNVRVLQRVFDHFADQCNFGLQQIATPWTFSIDADYVCPPELMAELVSLETVFDAWDVRFRYCVYGTALRSTLYPPRVVLHKTTQVCYVRDGHAHRVSIDGRVGHLTSAIYHDDRKPLSRWLSSQIRYSVLEADKLLSAPRGSLGWKDSIRKCMILAPFLTAVYCLIWKRLILDGRAGWYYTFQRVLAETMLSLELLDRKLRVLSGDETSRKT
jgi:glycosyltransferase involved in cell wall biosynthesis